MISKRPGAWVLSAFVFFLDRTRETVRDYFFIAAHLLEGLHLGLAHRRIA